MSAREPQVVEGEVVPVRSALPAVRCLCGKDGSLRSHGGFSCAEVLQIRARVEQGARRFRWGR